MRFADYKTSCRVNEEFCLIVNHFCRNYRIKYIFLNVLVNLLLCHIRIMLCRKYHCVQSLWHSCLIIFYSYLRFSGKDCTKVDRSAAYAARYVAKNIVAAGLAKKCEIQLSYAIGVAHPTSIMVDTFGTGKLSEEKLVEIIRENFDLRPAGIIEMLDLRRPIYKQTAAYGHFGRADLDLSWEKTDKAEILKSYL